MMILNLMNTEAVSNAGKSPVRVESGNIHNTLPATNLTFKGKRIYRAQTR